MAHIMVVDDDDAIRLLVCDTLEDDGHTMVDAGSVPEALAIFLQKEPDLIITDLIMPEQGGVDMLREVKAVSNRTPVIIMTGKPSVEAAVECLKTGATDFVSKPIDFAHLREVIAKSLETSQEAGTMFLPTQNVPIQVANYQVKRTLGVGNYGVVYLARKLDDGRLVALKVLKSDLAVGEASQLRNKQRFSREARMASRIRHPNVVEIYEYSVDLNIKVPYIAMEYVDGRPLKTLISDTQVVLTVEEKTDILLQIARALEAIHAKGLCHRDIKPHNVMVTDQMLAKLTDFGIVTDPSSELTSDSGCVGTPCYMSPESFYGGRVDQRADLFSLGVVAYELYMGQKPFNGDSIGQISTAIREARPPEPRRVQPDFPMGLQSIMSMLLRKDAEARYQDATSVIRDLEAIQAGGKPKTPMMEYLKNRVLQRDWT